MSIIDEKTRRFAANSIFPSFFYALLGLVLGQAGAVQMHGSWEFHVILGMPGLTLSGLLLCRARMHWTAAGADRTSGHASTFGWYLLLPAVGACIGMLSFSGSVLLLGIVAALTYLVPWVKIPVCRTRFVVSSVAILGGALAAVGVFGRSLTPLHLLVTAWALFVPPMFLQLLVMASLGREYRIGEPRLANEPI
ncbi:hypothetical protein [Massilia sp.]|uniref:hypothetical protein n=1 Tax=Massilia sp. TaxID=1882437 RepID=UPI0039190145